MKLRNSANSAWITLFQLDGEWSLIPFENGTAAAPSIYFKDSGTDTGIYSPGTDQVGISAGGTSRFEVSTTATTSTLPVVHPLGAVGTPSITFTGDLNTGIYSPAADTIAFVEGGVEAMRIDSSSRVGIGTTPDAPLHIKATGGSTNSINTALIVNYESTGPQVAGAGTAIVLRGSSGGGGTANYDQARIATSTTGTNNDHGIDFYTRRSAASGLVKRFSIDEYGGIRTYTVASSNPVAIFGFESGEAARIDSSGRLLVGTSSTSADCRALFQARSGSSSTNTTVVFSGGNSAPGTNEGLGYLAFSDSTHTLSAWVAGERDGGTWSGSSKPTRLVFSVTADGASSPTERMRIKSSGEIWSNYSFVMGKAGSFANYGGYFSYDSGADRLVMVNNSGGSGSGVGLAPGATSWATYSDERLKEIIEPIDDGLNKVGSLRAVIGKYKTDSDQTRRAFLIAQDVQAVLPEAVSADTTDDAYLDLRYTEVIPLLVAALKESKERIEILEQRLTDAGIA
jgi:hypothetical protein